VFSNHEDPSIPPEILNELNFNGFPAHKLELKTGCMVLLMRNIDIAGGLCNGTRLRVDETGKHLLICTILTGSCKGKTALIPRMNLLYDKGRIPFTRFQFPVKLCYAMTVHKAQGQGYDHVGIDFSGTIFTHGLVYVALSRCTSMKNIRIFFGPLHDQSNCLRNLVFTDLLQYANGSRDALPSPPLPTSPPPHRPEYDEPVPGISFDDETENEDHAEEDEGHGHPPPSSSPPRPLRNYAEYDVLTDDNLDALREWKSDGYEYEGAAARLFEQTGKRFSRDFWENEIRE
jgi:hypothetical protein